MVRPSGAKSWVFTWTEKGRQRRKTLGRFPTWSVGKARTHGGKMRLKADTGEEVVARNGSTVGELIEAWRKVVKLTRRPSTATAYGYMIDKNIKPEFGKMQPRDITRNAVEKWHGEIAAKTPIHTNRVLGALSSFMSWLEHDKLIDKNPCRGVKRRPENHRHVYLSGPEIAAAHEALRADNFNRAAGMALRLALLTGAGIGGEIATRCRAFIVGETSGHDETKEGSRAAVAARWPWHWSCWRSGRLITKAASVAGSGRGRSSSARMSTSTTSVIRGRRRWRAKGRASRRLAGCWVIPRRPPHRGMPIWWRPIWSI